MVLDLIVIRTDDGFIGEIPTIKGCESWAHSEEEVIEKVKELMRFYVGLDNSKEILIDRARKNRNKTIYKLVFEKQ